LQRPLRSIAAAEQRSAFVLQGRRLYIGRLHNGYALLGGAWQKQGRRR